MPQRSAIVSNRANASLNFIIRLLQEANLAGVDRSFREFDRCLENRLRLLTKSAAAQRPPSTPWRSFDVVRSERWFPVCNAVPGKKFSALQN
jgi:hypothetical protein